MSRRRRAPARVPPGVEVRHSSGCAVAQGGECDCRPSFRAWVSVPGTRKKLQRTLKRWPPPGAWREDVTVDLRRGARGAGATTVRDGADEWLRGARAGSIRNRSGDDYKPSVIRGYEQALRDYVLPELGGIKLTELRRAEVQAFVDRAVERGASASTVRNTLMPLRVICRRALVRGTLHGNPTQGLEIPAYRGRRERIVSPVETAALVAALPEPDSAIWATAIYAGLRRGELQALRWEDVDLARRLIRVSAAGTSTRA